MSIRANYVVVVDVETSGLDERKHEILQIARVVVDVPRRKILDHLTMEAYIYPERWPARNAEALGVNKITKDKLMTNGFVLEQVLGDWCRDIDWTQSVVGAWGIDFEARFLKSAFDLTKRVIPYPYQMIDIRTMAHIPKMRWGEIDYLGLREACELYNITCDKDQLHDALYDTQKEAEVLLAVLEELR